MAIQVVQGLIETGRQGAQSAAPGSSAQQPQQVAQNQIATAQAALTSAASAIQTFVSSEATLVTVRSTRSAGDPEKVRDGDSARRLADSVAEEIREGGENADGAHRSLSATNAREHFA